jgi:hypothetical protein
LIPPAALIAGLLAAVLGLPFGLYALLTREQRRTTREIRRAAIEQGWRYRLRRWQGNPTAFRIDGRTKDGLAWILTSGNTSGYDRGWSVQLSLRFPTLAGEADFSILPRGPRLAIPVGAEARIAPFGEAPTGVPGFDAAYQVMSRQSSKPVVDASLADRILHWPADSVAPHSILIWRDRFALHCQARLPAPPNSATVSWFLGIAAACASRIPPAVISPVRSSLVDRIIARVLR